MKTKILTILIVLVVLVAFVNAYTISRNRVIYTPTNPTTTLYKFIFTKPNGTFTRGLPTTTLIGMPTTTTLKHNVTITPEQIIEFYKLRSTIESWGGQEGYDQCKKDTIKLFKLK